MESIKKIVLKRGDLEASDLRSLETRFDEALRATGSNRKRYAESIGVLPSQISHVLTGRHKSRPLIAKIGRFIIQTNK